MVHRYVWVFVVLFAAFIVFALYDHTKVAERCEGDGLHVLLTVDDQYLCVKKDAIKEMK